MTTSDGVSIAVHELGGSGPPLVMSHATGFHGQVWRPMAHRLAARFHCWALDHRGHGESGQPPAQHFDWQGFGRDVLAVVDGLGLQAPSAIGHSAGGTAVLLAEQARPGTFAAIYCYEAVVIPADPPLGRDQDSWLAAAARRRRDVFASRQEAYEHYASKPPLGALDAATLRAYVDHGFEDLGDGRVRLRCRPEHEAVIAEMATHHDCFARLASIACPVMLAGGGNTEGLDRTTRPLAARLPRALTEVLPGLGHLGPLEEPGAVAISAERFLSRKGAGRELLGDERGRLPPRSVDAASRRRAR